MAEPLKNQFGAEIPHKIAAMLAAVEATFDTQQFVHDCLQGYESLELTARAKHISAQLAKHLPADFRQASQVLQASLGPRLEGTESFGMAPFVYLPHVYFVATHGMADFAAAMQLQYELTQRFTAEFSIRTFINQAPQQTLQVLETWCEDSSPHVRRLVSEGTRPLLPWAPRLTEFQQDPTPLTALLERLKDDPVLYVRRSVANHLNDLSKLHPTLCHDITTRWWRDASAERQWLVKHALRSAIKRGDLNALRLLGYGSSNDIEVSATHVVPAHPRIGESADISATVTNTSEGAVAVMLDLIVHFVKANGATRGKVFKVLNTQLQPGQSVQVKKSLSLRQLTTRTHYPGRHRLQWMLNGQTLDAGFFDLH